MRRAAALALLAAAVLAAAVLAGCGGGNDEEAVDLLDRGFSANVSSGYAAIDAELVLEGVEWIEGPLRVRLHGPFEVPAGGPAELPNLDMDFEASGAGQRVSGRLVLTPLNAWVEYGGTAYEVGEELWARARQALREQSAGEPQTFAAAGIDPLDWLRDSEVEGEERVSGVRATRVSGKLDMEALLRDANELSGSGRLPDRALDDVDEIVDDPEFDAWIGADGVWRRVATDIAFEVPEEERDSVGGLEGGRLSLEVELDRPNEYVEIVGPGDARPIDELLRRLGIPPEQLLGPGFATPTPG